VESLQKRRKIKTEGMAGVSRAKLRLMTDLRLMKQEPPEVLTLFVFIVSSELCNRVVALVL
jgi:hypothetical protein